YRKNSLIARLLARTLETCCVRPIQIPGGEVGQIFLQWTSYVSDQPEREPGAFAEMKGALEAGYRLCQAQGIKLFVVFVPIKVRVLAPFIGFRSDEDRNRWLPDGRTETKGDLGDALGAFCAHLGCPYVDTYPLLRRAANSDCRAIYVLGRDTHLDVG